MKYTESGKVGDAGDGALKSDSGRMCSYPPNYPRVDEPAQTESVEVFSVPATDALSLKIVEQNRTKIFYKDVVDPHTGSFSTRHNGLA